jgi:hypothetical protein
MRFMAGNTRKFGKHGRRPTGWLRKSTLSPRELASKVVKDPRVQERILTRVRAHRVK